ncbi:IDH3 [Lepeophtheirus salmonis]|uniref:IDH3 n=1 Tax=Lepeophtheirus salmonis TaxID=72036 RepID=A0A7R8HDG5_LEPSM|nr:IDH3 [Lepeophtheirus salmonis]CAF3034766.1 IDH3 [Lepeophtheirus salmonis]
MRSIGSLAHHSKLLHTSSKLSSLNVTNGRINCTMIPGDGVGPEIMDSVIRVVSATGAPINFETLQLSEVQHETSASLSDVCESVRKNENELDLYANVVKIRSLRGVKTRHSNLDMVIIREQTEGEIFSLGT